MELLYVYLRGWKGIKRGMGLDELRLDLSDLTGLVAFAGPNGKGKSTVLENCQPYRTLISRKKALQFHVFLRDSVKELAFIFNGNKYRTLIKIDAESGKQEGFIYKNDSEESETAGKVSEYDEYIENLFGSQELFVNSIFCAQNSKKLSDMKPAPIKNLFAEFLRLNKLIAHEDTAKQCVAIINDKIELIDKEILRLEEKVQNKEDLRKEITESKNTISTHEANLKQIEDDINALNKELDAEKEKKAKHEIALQRIKDVEESKTRINKDIETDQLASEQELTGLRRKGQSIIAELRETDTLLENEENIKTAANDLKRIDKDLEKAIADQADANKKRTETLEKQEKVQKEILVQAQDDCLKAQSDEIKAIENKIYICKQAIGCLLYTSPSPRDRTRSRMPSSA